MPVRVAIIGSPGRSVDVLRLYTKEVYDSMKAEATRIIHSEWNLAHEDVELVSGGAAWADHVAVDLYTENLIRCTLGDGLHAYAGLRLHLPCPWNGQRREYRRTQGRGDPSAAANAAHLHFSAKISMSTLTAIDSCLDDERVKHTVHDGFHERNRALASEADFLISFTWSMYGYPIFSEGATNYIWNYAKTKNRIHVSLHSLVSPS